MGRYYRIFLMELSGARLNPIYWENKVTKEELELAKKFFNKNDSDIAIITSELADLHITSLCLSAESKFNPTAMSQPASVFSSMASIQRIEEIMCMDKQLQVVKTRDINAAVSTSTEKVDNSKVLEDTSFPNYSSSNPLLYRIDTGACLFFDFQNNELCKEPAIDNTARCVKHQDNTNSKFMKILAEMSDAPSGTKFHLARSVVRSFSRPEESLNPEVFEYAPCLEGALPAFKDSTCNLEKILMAGWESFKANMSKDTPFNDRFYKQRFPNSPEISFKLWFHTFWATLVNISYRNNYLVGLIKLAIKQIEKLF